MVRAIEDKSVGNVDRRAGSVFEDPVQLPVVDELSKCTFGIVEEQTTLADRQTPYAAKGKDEFTVVTVYRIDRLIVETSASS